MSSPDAKTTSQGPLLDQLESIQSAANVLRALANVQRLQILCHLANSGELSVGALLERVDLSQSALSQHLGRLREEGIVGTRKDRQNVFYRIVRQDILSIMETLHGLYCKA